MTETDARKAPRLDAALPSSSVPAAAEALRRGWPARLGLWSAWAVAAACVVLTVLWRVGDGFDHTDEAFYLLTAAPPRPDDAYNGLSGLYLRLLWELAGWNVAAVRVLGAVLLVATAVLLGTATARIARRRPAVVVAATVAASTGYYVPLLRTPSYNWLAVVGAGLACTGVLRLLARESARWGALCGLGVVVGGLGKATTGLALALVVVAVALRTRPRALAWSGAVGLVALVVHAVAVLPLDATVRSLVRSSRHLAVLAPGYYTPSGVVVETALGLAFTLAVCAALGGGVGLLPFAAAPHPRRAEIFAALAAVALALCVAAALVTRAWPLRYDGAQPAGTGLLAVLECLVLTLAAGRLLRLEHDSARRPLAAAGVLIVAALGCVAGSNVSFGFLLNMTGLLLAPACFCIVAALPRSSVPVVLPALVAAVCAGSLVAATGVQREPKWTGPLVRATSPVQLGPVTVRVDGNDARQLLALRGAAVSTGWRSGMPLVDATYLPSVPLLLGADVPPVLLPTAASWLPLTPVCSAVRGLGPAWRNAWLLVPDGLDAAGRARIAGYLGRRYPQDYRTVASFTDRFVPLGGVLLRPVAPATVPWSAAVAATTCLGPGDGVPGR